MRGAEHAEHPLQAVGVDDVANPHEVQVAGRDPDDQVGLPYDPEDEVEPVLTFDLTGFDVLDHGGPMIWVDHRLTDCEGHIVRYPFRDLKFSTLSGSPEVRPP